MERFTKNLQVTVHTLAEIMILQRENIAKMAVNEKEITLIKEQVLPYGRN